LVFVSTSEHFPTTRREPSNQEAKAVSAFKS
jgi:hypothetical protein